MEKKTLDIWPASHYSPSQWDESPLPAPRHSSHSVCHYEGLHDCPKTTSCVCVGVCAWTYVYLCLCERELPKERFVANDRLCSWFGVSMCQMTSWSDTITVGMGISVFGSSLLWYFILYVNIGSFCVDISGLNGKPRVYVRVSQTLISLSLISFSGDLYLKEIFCRRLGLKSLSVNRTLWASCMDVD